MGLHIHLDPVGGMAGDMFAAALIDAFPQHRTGMLNAIRQAGVPKSVTCRIVEHRDHALTGKRFVVTEKGEPEHHRAYREIRDMLTNSKLPVGLVHGLAATIYLNLAQAEAEVHGVPYIDVTFHELGGWDSIADVVAASYLYAVTNATWSVGPLPLGSGRVKSAHGDLPVPAPATAVLLKGFTTFDDGIPGERVTPTGAAILKTLPCESGYDGAPRKLIATGTGFGTRKLPRISNVLRALVFEDSGDEVDWHTDRVAQINFEVDDQTPEDLAVGLDLLRAVPGVRDVVQFAGIGKKGRATIHVQAICSPDRKDAAIAACFKETTTIGLRVATVDRAVLPREIVRAEGMAVKRSRRPGGGTTAKAEIDAVAKRSGAVERETARWIAASAVLKKPLPRKK